MDAEALDLLPLDALIGALARRYDAVVFAGVNHLDSEKKQAGNMTYNVRFHGNVFECIGLANFAASVAAHDVHHPEPTDGPDDES